MLVRGRGRGMERVGQEEEEKESIFKTMIPHEIAEEGG